MNRKLKKYNLKYEYLKLEEEDIRSELDKYISDFENYFDKYYNSGSSESKEVWVNEETGEIRDDPPSDNFEYAKKQQEEFEKKRKSEVEELKNRPDRVKRLYKKLAIKSHPDRGGSDEFFQQVNTAYKENNLIWLLFKAGEYGIEYDVEPSDESILESNLKKIEKEIYRMKDTLAWLWGTGNSKERKRVVSVVESQTGHIVSPDDLPSDLKEPKTELLDKK